MNFKAEDKKSTIKSIEKDNLKAIIVLTTSYTPVSSLFAGAFQVIHTHLDAAMEAASITGKSGTLNKNAKAAARSAFESSKQRFFNHLLTAMKTSSLPGRSTD